jgi:hypothetical protein
MTRALRVDRGDRWTLGKVWCCDSRGSACAGDRGVRHDLVREGIAHFVVAVAESDSAVVAVV